MKARLILEDGTEFIGKSLGQTGLTIGEVVFYTGMTGYQEVLTDASYYGQIVTMTYPLIGNYGVNAAYNEGDTPKVKGFIARESCDTPSNFNSEGTLAAYLKEHDVIGIEDIDTRALTRQLRDKGTMNGAIITEDIPWEKESLLNEIRAFSIENAVESVTIASPVEEQVQDAKYRITVLDFGYKRNIIRSLKERGCTVTLLPGTSTFEEVQKTRPDGIMLTNGPGDPEKNPGIIKEIGKLLEANIPLFGICLGHQLAALACGFKTKKLTYGHRGGNHPVKAINTGRIYITSQNHGYAVVNESVDSGMAKISHVNMNDNTCEGIVYTKYRAFTVQFHPEACAGPQDTAFLFDEFLAMVAANKGQEVDICQSV